MCSPSLLRFSLILAFAFSGWPQSLPPDMRQGLEREAHFSNEDFAKVESGKAIGRIIATKRPDDVRMVGLVLIRTTPEKFIEGLRNIETFAENRDVVWTRRFSNPPKESDLAQFHAGGMKDEILACQPGHCAFKLPAEAMKEMQQGVDWKAPDAAAKADAFVRRRLVDYVNNYREKGDSALAVYYDTEAPYSVAEGLHSLIGSETAIGKRVPELVRYATEYPAHRPANVEDFFFAQEVAFGLKHVLRTEHVIIQKIIPADGGEAHYAIISKMLFASHYFRAGMEFQYVYPVKMPNGEPAIFLLSAQRSYVDGMTGVKGAIVRKVAEGRSPARLAESLEQLKGRLEHP